jgi:hypothetical protein
MIESIIQYIKRVSKKIGFSAKTTLKTLALGIAVLSASTVLANAEKYEVVWNYQNSLTGVEPAIISIVFPAKELHLKKPFVFHKYEKTSPFSENSIYQYTEVYCDFTAYILNLTDTSVGARLDESSSILGALLTVDFSNGTSLDATSNFEFSKYWSFTKSKKILKANAADKITFRQDVPTIFDSMDAFERYENSGGCSQLGKVTSVSVRYFHGDIIQENGELWRSLETATEIATFSADKE